MCHEKGTKKLPPCLLPAITRRRFLGSAAIAAGSLPLLSACEFSEVKGADGEVAESVSFDVSEPDYTELGTVGGLAALDLGGGLGVLLVRVSEDQVVAFFDKCPHLNLPLTPALTTWDEDAQQIVCPYHQSRFETQGGYVQDSIQEAFRGDQPVSDITLYEVDFDASTGLGEVFVVRTDSASDDASMGS